MTGKEMAKTLAEFRGHIYVAAVMKNDSPYIRVVKADIIDHFNRVGNEDADAEFRVTTSGKGIVDSH